MKKLTKAITFAAHCHEGQTRKGSNTPYISHPLEALAIAATITNDANVLSAAVLHDVLEDCGVSPEEIQSRFGNEVLRLVCADTEDKRESLPASDTWKIRKQETLNAISLMDRESQIIVLADKLSNIRAISRDYSVLGDELWQRFNCKQKSEHKWYYEGILELLKFELGNTAAWQEYRELTDKIFG